LHALFAVAHGQVLKVSGTSSQCKSATRLIPLVAKPHWLLCTLLLCNAAFMEALPLFLDRLLDPVGALLLSVTAILLFGEIIPQAVCSR
jgi:metal transporter CNNM